MQPHDTAPRQSAWVARERAELVVAAAGASVTAVLAAMAGPDTHAHDDQLRGGRGAGRRSGTRARRAGDRVGEVGEGCLGGDVGDPLAGSGRADAGGVAVARVDARDQIAAAERAGLRTVTVELYERRRVA